jgi:hypothetical protein
MQPFRIRRGRLAGSAHTAFRRWRPILAASMPLGLALGLSMPVLALVRLEGLAPATWGWAVDFTAVPDGDWTGGWSETARTVAEWQGDAFRGALRLFVALALVVWLTGLVGSVLGSLRRMGARRAEWMLRSVVGATRRQLHLLALAEGLASSALAGALGLLVAAAGCELLARTLPPAMVPTARTGASMLFTPTVALLLAITLTAVTAIPLLLLPSVEAFRRPADTGPASSRADAIWLLAMGQVATSVAITACAILLAGGAPSPEETTDLYPNARDTLVLRLRLPEGVEPRRSWEAAREAVRRLPGVEAASVSSPGAILGLGTVDRGGSHCPTCTSGGLAMPVTFGWARHMAVDEAFFEVLGIEGPAPTREGGVVIDRVILREWFQGGDAVGRTVWSRGVAPLRGPGLRVAGVAAVPRPTGLGVAGRPPGGIYLPLGDAAPLHLDVAIRGSAAVGDGAAGLADGARAVIERAAPGSRVRVLGHLDQLLAEQTAPVLWLARGSGGLAAGALLFAVLGISGAMVERVRVRRPEIGLRMAVGARRRTIVRLVLVDAGRLVLVGSLLGGALAASLNRGLPKLVGGVEPLGLAAFGSLVVLLLAAGLMASLGAALRAARLGPVAALRD